MKYEFLKKIPLFAAMPDEDFDQLCEIAEEFPLRAGEQLFAEGSIGRHAYVIMEGELAIVKTSGRREVLLAVRPAGEVIGEMALLDQAPRMASVRAHTDATVLAIHHVELDKLLNNSPSAARAMLSTVVARLRNTEAMLRENDKMVQLGTLSAGVAHELNNPAAAVQRGAGQLQEAITRLGRAREQFMTLDLTPAQRERVAALLQKTETARRAGNLSALQRSDLEYELETWLEKKNVPDAWQYTSTLVDLGFDLPKLDTLHADLQLANLPSPALGSILALLVATHSVNTLLLEVGHGASRIAQIVQALKGYSYLDQAPVQDVDVHEGLENTLIILRDRLADIEIQREYAQDLPTIQAYGSELNQVFTNILHNAADALDGEGRIIIRTRKGDESVIIEIEDNGPGIPADIVGRIFEAFYTTKEPGKGTGLGLNISYNIIVHKHRGELSVRSEPGKTCFYIEIPTNFEADSGPSRRDARRGVAAAHDDDEMLRSILQSINTIAVVGMSADPRKVAHTVPLYLRDHGYEIMPVNPRGGWLAGLRVYRDLLSLPKVPDAVLIFRPSREAPAIVDQAIQIAARVVWMESGIRHDGAAQKARDAGLDVVMDTCMRTVHKRLLA